MSSWLDYDFDSTIRDFEYTRRAAAGISRVMDSDDFRDMDADMIFEFLSKEMEVVLFPDYLKRYIYEKLEIDRPFGEVPTSFYQKVISDCLEDNQAPYSFTPTSTKKTAMIKLWLTQPNVRRSVIFVLGFALRMNPEEVSEFLTKVIKEEDFRFTDPFETICWFCYRNDLPYANAAALLKQYEGMQPESFSEKKWNAMHASPTLTLLTQANLLAYLSLLKGRDTDDDRAYREFLELYEKCCAIICDEYNEESRRMGKKADLTPDRIRPADLEKALCSGIPVNRDNNLTAMSASRFASLFSNRRMSRQRISGILSRSHPVERFDLITLLFYIYAQTVEPDWPAERYLQYIDAVNELLGRCGMMGIYPANPYEAFVLMCIVTDYPLDVYSQVWELSYESDALQE